MTFAPDAPPPPPASKRPVWPWIVGGLALLVVLAIGGAIAVVLFAAGQKEADAEAVEQAVLDFDSAYEQVDCDLFEELTTKDLRDELYEVDGYDCDAFEAAAEGLFDEDGDYTYEVDVESVTVDGDEAEVETTESWEYEGDTYSSVVTYGLERVDGRWLISEYDNEDPELTGSDNSDENQNSGSDDDNQYKADLANAKVALVSFAVAEGGFIASFDDLAEYGLTLDASADMTLESSIDGFCFEKTSPETGITYAITDSSPVGEARCSELDF